MNSSPRLGSAASPKLWSETHTWPAEADCANYRHEPFSLPPTPNRVPALVNRPQNQFSDLFSITISVHPYKDMSRLTVTNFSKRTGSPFQSKSKESSPETTKVVHEETLQKSHFEKQKEKQSELIQKVNKKTAEYQSNKPSSGVFTEVVTHGAFTTKSQVKEKSPPVESVSQQKNTNGSNSKSLLGFPSSANDLALDAKTDLESDPNISKDVKEKVIEKLFKLVSMVQHTYESKVRIMTEFEKYKDTHMKNELRREKEHSEQLYKINMNFQNEVVQAIQRLKSELDITRNVTDNVEQSDIDVSKNSSVDFHTEDALKLSDKKISDDDEEKENKMEQLENLQKENLQQVEKVDND